jgi:hypothetical protein
MTLFNFKDNKGVWYCFASFTALAMACIFIMYPGFSRMYSAHKLSGVHQTLRHLKPGLDPCIGSYIALSVQKASDKTGIPVNLIIAMMWVESRFNVNATSKAGAVGLMQIMEEYHRDTMENLRITSNDIYHVDKNILLGSTILKGYIVQEKSIRGGLERYLGKHGPKYFTKVLETYTNLRLLPLLAQPKLTRENVK